MPVVTATVSDHTKTEQCLSQQAVQKADRGIIQQDGYLTFC